MNDFYYSYVKNVHMGIVKKKYFCCTTNSTTMRNILMAIFAISLISCESENESKFAEIIIPGDTTTAKPGELASFPFQNNISDHSGNSFPIFFSGIPAFKKSNLNDSALVLASGDFVQFMVPRADTFSFSFFLKGNKAVPSNGATILNIKDNAIVELDATSGATKISFDKNIKDEDIFNTYKNWFFVYVEILGSKTAKIVIKNKETSELKTFTYTLPLKAPVYAGDMVRIGNSFLGQNSFKGVLDELKMFDRSLSATELEWLYQNQ